MTASDLRNLPVATRMLVTSLFLVVVALPLAGALLSWNFRQAVTTAFDERLESLLNVVLAGVEYDPAEDRLISIRALGDARFDQVFSGWYWQVTDTGERTLASRSLWDQRLEVSDESGLAYAYIEGPRGQQLRKLERDVRLPNLADTLHVSVAASLDEVNAEVARFSQLLWLSLIALGAVLLSGIWLQIRWGLEPLRRIRANLSAVEQGRCDRLSTDLPRELSQLAAAINTVLERDEHLIERGRTAAGNLAHALKTPVAVLSTLAERLPVDQRDEVRHELHRLDDAVRHHLARASAAGPISLRTNVDAASALAPVFGGITRLAHGRGLIFVAPDIKGLRVRVDAQDLQEIVGNLLENAVQWAHSRVFMQCHADGSSICLQVSDDGPGMTPDERDAALLRGGKLDEKQSGSGLGLAIVNDLVQLYGGRLHLDRAEIGGLRVDVNLPTH